MVGDMQLLTGLPDDARLVSSPDGTDSTGSVEAVVIAAGDDDEPGNEHAKGGY